MSDSSWHEDSMTHAALIVLALIPFQCDGTTYFVSCHSALSQDVELANGRAELSISEPEEWEVNRPILCTLKIDGKVVENELFCDADTGENRGEIYRALNPEGPVVGLVRKADPDGVLFIVDVDKRRWWPNTNQDGEDFVSLLEELQQRTRRPDLVFRKF